jgi:hypothetical protein
MKEPESLSYFFAGQASGKLPSSSSAAEQYPPEVDETFRSLAAENHRKQFGREGLGAESDGV